MKNFICLSFLFVFFHGKVDAETDSLSLITFKTTYEEQVLSKSNANNLARFLAIDENITPEKAENIEKRINAFIVSLKNKNFQSRSNEKKIKLVFDETHKKFLRKYQNVVNFNKIFETGEYNCVSASALYAMILEGLYIPYQIKETPTHVYLIAYPQTNGIVLESTSPTDGYFVQNEKTMQNAVNYLIELKYVTKEEVDNKGIKKVYNNFFHSQENIDIHQLAGIQYYNEALTDFSNKEYIDAYNAIIKAEILYTSKRTEFIKHALLGNILNKATFSELKDIIYYTEFANLEKSEKSNIISLYEEMIINNHLYVESDVSFTVSAFDYISKNIKDNNLLKTISENHYNGLSKFYYHKSERDSTLKYATLAYELNDKNITTQSLIGTSILQSLSKNIGSEKITTKIDEYQEQYPFLEENKDFQGFRFLNITILACYQFVADDLTNGLKNLRLLNQLEEKNININENQYGLVYAEAGALYYRLRQYKKAKEILEEGLQKMPDHPELKVRLDIVLEELR